uniref:Putative secreted protein n=1 Tax=Anopheles triannulatus TaxID=58253 RepID=A0A2M4B5D1_9DIPT
MACGSLLCVCLCTFFDVFFFKLPIMQSNHISVTPKAFVSVCVCVQKYWKWKQHRTAPSVTNFLKIE